MGNSSLAEFCEKYEIKMTLKRKWYEYIFQSSYHMRQIKYKGDLSFIKLSYEILANEVKNAKMEYSKEEEKIAPFTDKRLNISMPAIDFSDLDCADKALSCYRLYFRSGGGIYQKMYAETRKVWRTAQIDIIRKAVKELPANKNVVVIENTFTPTYEETKYNFSKCVEELARSPKIGIPSIRACGISEWIAFCPRVQNINTVIRTWNGNPVGVKVNYF